MKNLHFLRLSLTVAILALAAASLTTACSSGSSGMTRTSVHYGAGYRGYYRRPWGYPPAYIGGGIDDIDPDWGVEAPGEPIAVPLPAMGMPDMGGMDFGGFDW